MTTCLTSRIRCLFPSTQRQGVVRDNLHSSDRKLHNEVWIVTGASLSKQEKAAEIPKTHTNIIWIKETSRGGNCPEQPGHLDPQQHILKPLHLCGQDPKGRSWHTYIVCVTGKSNQMTTASQEMAHKVELLLQSDTVHINPDKSRRSIVRNSCGAALPEMFNKRKLKT